MMRSSNIEKLRPVGEWMVQMIVRPPSAASRLRSTTTESAVRESSPLVGSSRNNTRGLVMSARPMLTRFACPPDMPRSALLPMTVCRHDSNSSISMTSSTRRFFSSIVVEAGSLREAVYFSIFSTVNSDTSVSNCSTYPI
mmetsp:Transcript_39168/g.76454  ORF Transcript_39168/g.76454 Transcript_39168/m.76454 type:complete len:140 (-) Transcript_39168:481-900(-)